MSGDESTTNPEDEKNFFVDRAKTGRAACKKCKQKIEAGSLRLAKNVYSPFGTGKMKQWHHVPCLFEVFKKQRAKTAKIEHYDDVGGWDKINDQDKEHIFTFLPDSSRTPRNPDNGDCKVNNGNTGTVDVGPKKQKEDSRPQVPIKDNLFREYRRLCILISNESSYLQKTAVVKKFITEGSDGSGFKGDLILWLRLLLPGIVKRIYNLQSKQIIKLFSRIFHQDQDEMLEDLEKGDVAETVRVFFEKSSKCRPVQKSLMTVQDVDVFLEQLSKMTREEDQSNHFITFIPECTSNDLKMIVRLIKHDLRINAGAKHILDAVHPDAYQAFQASRDISTVVNRLLNQASSSGDSSPKKPGSGQNVSIALLTPVLPMLATACKSVEMAMKKCPNGMYSEIKYDGERVQVHKKGSAFKYFSRSLKPVLPHKVEHFKNYIPEAFPHGKDLILDSEILMVDVNTGNPLPFGTLGKHKKSEFKDACVCLFVFDCLYYNNESLLNRPIKERRQILRQNMKQIPNHVVFSEMEEIHVPKDLENMMTKVFRHGLEGLVLKDIMSQYKPGKRHWLKVKKDYLFDGAMADTADLVVVGAWYGTGQKGGMMSVFLMGCYDQTRKKWCTVTKVHTGHDDKTLDRLQTELDMIKISKDQSKVPGWLLCTKTMVPDFVARDPKKQPVWEITGAEFTQHDVHTAAGISVRFPRVTKIRSDKDWETATNLAELKELFEKSKDSTDFALLSTTSEPSSSAVKKRKGDHVNTPTKKPRTDSSSSSSNSPDKKQRTLLVAQSNSENNDESGSPPLRDIEYGRKPVVGKNSNIKNGCSEEEKMRKIKKLKKPLPDVFTGVKLFISEIEKDNIKNMNVLRRYFIAFGGRLLKKNEEGEATHVMKSRLQKKNVSNGAITIPVEWLWDSIKLKRQQDCSVY